jgi:hypothetical protein
MKMQLHARVEPTAPPVPLPQVLIIDNFNIGDVR